MCVYVYLHTDDDSYNITTNTLWCSAVGELRKELTNFCRAYTVTYLYLSFSSSTLTNIVYYCITLKCFLAILHRCATNTLHFFIVKKNLNVLR